MVIKFRQSGRHLSVVGITLLHTKEVSIHMSSPTLLFSVVTVSAGSTCMYSSYCLIKGAYLQYFVQFIYLLVCIPFENVAIHTVLCIVYIKITLMNVHA